MPIYVYRRRDGSCFELEQRITVDALVRCPTTNQSVERVMQPFTPRYSGTGFYATDHHKDTPPEGPSRGRMPPGGDSPAERSRGERARRLPSPRRDSPS
jgi:predicted nucleic acid-binding Zn ribbon protein